jgi:Ni,Fe-hydrogenase maturation factor
MTKLLVFGYGNPGRGDDILGPKLAESIETLNLYQVFLSKRYAVAD